MTLKEVYKEAFPDIDGIFRDKNSYNKSAEGKIKEIFKTHEKEHCFTNLENNDKYKFDRSFHSVSVYMLGLYLLKTKFYSGLDVFSDFCKDFQFEPLSALNNEQISGGINYIWTLASLYHDVVTSREDSREAAQYANHGNNPFITPETFINISGMFGKEKVIHTIFNENPEIDKITKNTGKTNFEKLPYSKNQIEGYFRYRLNDGKADHGIVSGYIFYDALVKNYLKKLEKYLRENPNAKETDEFDSKNNRKYRPKHLVLFKIIANAIICHNIWRYEKETKLKYFDFGICSEEFESSKNLLTEKENPLLFFLCLADTLEPTKFFYQFDAQKVLEGIEIEADETKLTLTIKEDFAANCETIEKWFEKIESMKKWMKIDVERGTAGKSIEILLGKKAGMKKRKALNLV